MTDKLTDQQKAAIGMVTDRLFKAEKLEMYKRMYNVTNDREPGEPKGYLIDEADDLQSLVGIDYSSVEDQIAAYWLGLEDRRIPVKTDDFKSIPYTVAYDGKSSRAGRNNLHFNKAVAKRRKANKAARKARAKAR